jgi:S-adenosylmethionine-dependent carboxyl methyltransferase
VTGSGRTGGAPAQNVMERSGFYNEHSAQQREAATAGIAMLRAAAGETPVAGEGPIVVADYGASQGKNSLHPLRAALAQIRGRDGAGQVDVTVVHTDLPENDFTSLFETVAHDPETYAGAGVFTYAAGRSFYEQLFPDDTVSLGWSATAVVWLRETPCPLPDHLFSYAATGDRRLVWAKAAADDWETFLRLRSAELRSGGEMVVTTLVSGPGYLDWMTLIEAGARDTLEAGTLDRPELEAMVIPTYIRAPDEFFGAVEGGGLPLTLVDSTIEVARDPAFEAFRDHRDAGRYSHEAVAAYRAWSEPALMSALAAGRTADERAAIADDLYEHTRARLEASPTECAWRIGLARIRRDARHP